MVTRTETGGDVTPPSTGGRFTFLGMSVALVLILVTLVVGIVEGARAVIDVTDSSLNATLAASSNVVLAFVANWCGRCRQLDPNLQWAAERFKEEGIENVAICRMDLSDIADAQSERLKDRFAVSELPTVVWVNKRGHSHFEGSMTANGIHQWAREKIAAEEIGNDLAACDACRVTLEAMHKDWGALVSRLVEAGSVITGQSPRLSESTASQQAAILGVCESKAMKELSGTMQEGCRKQLGWHGHDVVGRHFGLFASWCQRSGDRGRALSERELEECAEQWSSKVGNGRLGLHEKIMGICGREGAGGIVRVCEFRGSGWKEAARAGREQHASKCEMCRAAVGDAAFALRTSALGQLGGSALRKRRLEAGEVLEGLCEAGLNRHEGDATEGPSKRQAAACGELLEEAEEALLEALLESAARAGPAAIPLPALEHRVCAQLYPVC